MAMCDFGALTTNVTGRPRDLTMEINGGSAESYLARTLCVLVVLLESKKRLDFQGRRGITSVVRWNLRLAILGAERLAVRTAQITIRSSFGQGKSPNTYELFARIAPGLGGVQKVVFMFFFFSAHFLVGKRKH